MVLITGIHANFALRSWARIASMFSSAAMTAGLSSA